MSETAVVEAQPTVAPAAPPVEPQPAAQPVASPVEATTPSTATQQAEAGNPQAAATAPVVDQPPKEKDFKTAEAYEEALAKYEAEQAAKKIEEQEEAAADPLATSVKQRLEGLSTSTIKPADAEAFLHLVADSTAEAAATAQIMAARESVHGRRANGENVSRKEKNAINKELARVMQEAKIHERDAKIRIRRMKGSKNPQMKAKGYDFEIGMNQFQRSQLELQRARLQERADNGTISRGHRRVLENVNNRIAKLDVEITQSQTTRAGIKNGTEDIPNQLEPLVRNVLGKEKLTPEQQQEVLVSPINVLYKRVSTALENPSNRDTFINSLVENGIIDKKQIPNFKDFMALDGDSVLSDEDKVNKAMMKGGIIALLIMLMVGKMASKEASEPAKVQPQPQPQTPH